MRALAVQKEAAGGLDAEEDDVEAGIELKKTDPATLLANAVQDEFDEMLDEAARCCESEEQRKLVHLSLSLSAVCLSVCLCLYSHASSLSFCLHTATSPEKERQRPSASTTSGGLSVSGMGACKSWRVQHSLARRGHVVEQRGFGSLVCCTTILVASFLCVRVH